MKVIKVFEDTHRELKIESAHSGTPMEVLASSLLISAIEERRSGKLKPDNGEGAPVPAKKRKSTR